MEKLFSKLDFGGPNGFFPTGNPSIEVAPPRLMGFPEGRGRLDPQNSGFEKSLSGWVAACGLPTLGPPSLMQQSPYTSLVVGVRARRRTVFRPGLISSVMTRTAGTHRAPGSHPAH